MFILGKEKCLFEVNKEMFIEGNKIIINKND